MVVCMRRRSESEPFHFPLQPLRMVVVVLPTFRCGFDHGLPLQLLGFLYFSLDFPSESPFGLHASKLLLQHQRAVPGRNRLVPR